MRGTPHWDTFYGGDVSDGIDDRPVKQIRSELRAAIVRFLDKETHCESVSHLLKLLQQDGWTNSRGGRGVSLGNISTFERLCESLGFTVRIGYNDRNQERWEIALEEEHERVAREAKEKLLRDSEKRIYAEQLRLATAEITKKLECDGSWTADGLGRLSESIMSESRIVAKERTKREMVQLRKII